MSQTICDDAGHMFIFEPIDDVSPITLGLDQLCLAKNAKLM